jgi:hypothetical protein
LISVRVPPHHFLSHLIRMLEPWRWGKPSGSKSRAGRTCRDGSGPSWGGTYVDMVCLMARSWT